MRMDEKVRPGESSQATQDGPADAKLSAGAAMLLGAHAHTDPGARVKVWSRSERPPIAEFKDPVPELKRAKTLSVRQKSRARSASTRKEQAARWAKIQASVAEEEYARVVAKYRYDMYHNGWMGNVAAGIEDLTGESLEENLRHRSVFFFSGESTIRQACICLRGHWLFNAFIFMSILANCVFIAMDDGDSNQDLILTSEWVFTGIFSAEAVVRIIARGFYYCGPASYFRDPFNKLDFFVVIMSYISLLLRIDNISAVRALRLLKPLRAIKSIKGLRVLVTTLLASLPGLIDVTLLYFSCLCIFSILGMQLFLGTFRNKCQVDSLGTFESDARLCSTNNLDSHRCAVGESCVDSDQNPTHGTVAFDNVLIAQLTLFVCTTLEGWSEVMFDASDAYSTSVARIFFFLAIIILGLFIFKLVVAVVYIRFDKTKSLDSKKKSFLEQTREKSRRQGIAALAQNSLVDATPSLERVKTIPPPPVPKNKFQKRMYHLVQSEAFQGWIIVAIVVNLILLSLEHYDQPDSLTNFLFICNVVLTVVFGVELILKLIGLNPSGYIKDRLNVFDALVVFVSVLEMVLGDGAGNGLTVLRSFRVIRIFKLLRNWVGLRDIVLALFASLYDISYFMLILLIFVFVYAVLGVQLFRSRFDFGDVENGQPVDTRPNFDNLGLGVLSVFQIVTGENWNDLMYKGIRAVGWGAVAYFITIYAVGVILMSLFLAIVLGNFHLTDEIDEDREDQTVGSLVKSAFSCCFWSGARVHPIDSEASEDNDGGDDNASLGVQTTLFGGSFSFFGRQRTEAETRKRKPLVFRKVTLSTGRGVSTFYGTHQGISALEEEAKADPRFRKYKPRAPVMLAKMGRQMSMGHVIEAKVLASKQQSLTPKAFDDFKEERFKRRILHARKKSQELRARSAALGKFAQKMSSSSGRSSPVDFDRKRPSPPRLSKGSPAGRLGDSDGEDEEQGRDGKEQRKGLDTPQPVASPPPKLVRRVSMTQDGKVLKDALRLEGEIDGSFNDDELSPQRQISQVEADQQRYLKSGGARSIFSSTETRSIILYQYSLGLFGPDSWIRLQLLKLVEHPLVNRVIYFFILFSCICLTLDRPGLDSSSVMFQFLRVSDILVTCVFSFEALAHCIVYGMYEAPNAYLRDAYNRIDFFVVLVSLANIALSQFRFIKGLRAARALRAMRTITHSSSMRIVANSIFSTMPMLGNIAMVGIVLFLIFGVIGVQSFKGQLRVCIDNDGVVLNSHDRAACDLEGYSWRNRNDGNFDNIGSALLLLFEVASVEAWPVRLYNLMDATNPDEAPRRNSNAGPAASYYISFFFIGSFLIISLVVGIVVEGYYIQHAKHTGGDIKKQQQLWLMVYRDFVFRPPIRVPTPPSQPSWLAPYRRSAFKLVRRVRFEIVITAVILLDVLVMAMTFHGEPSTYKYALEVTSNVFAAIFVLEMLLKWLGLGIKEYFSSGMNQFDCAIVVVSVLSILLRELTAGWTSVDPVIFRVFRCLRILRLFVKSSGLKRMLNTLYWSLGALSNISMVLALIAFIYAVAGVSLFADVERGEFVNEHSNFSNFFNSFTVLVRVCTGENWNGIMHDCMDDSPFAVPYFVSYVILSGFLMVNLFVAVIVKNFENEEELDFLWQLSPVKRDHIDDFIHQWEKLFENRRFISTSHFMMLLDKLKPEGLKPARDPKMLSIPQNTDRKVHYLDCIQACCVEKFALVFPSRVFAKIPSKNPSQQIIRRKISASYPELKNNTFMYCVDHYYAAIKLQRWFRRMKKTRRALNMAAEKLRTQRDARIDFKEVKRASASKRNGRETQGGPTELDRRENLFKNSVIARLQMGVLAAKASNRKAARGVESVVPGAVSKPAAPVEGGKLTLNADQSGASVDETPAGERRDSSVEDGPNGSPPENDGDGSDVEGGTTGAVEGGTTGAVWDPLKVLLEKLDMADYLPRFQEERFTVQDVQLLAEAIDEKQVGQEELKSLVPHLGPRLRLSKYLKMLANPGGKRTFVDTESDTTKPKGTTATKALTPTRPARRRQRRRKTSSD